MDLPRWTTYVKGNAVVRLSGPAGCHFSAGVGAIAAGLGASRHVAICPCRLACLCAGVAGLRAGLTGECRQRPIPRGEPRRSGTCIGTVKTQVHGCGVLHSTGSGALCAMPIAIFAIDLALSAYPGAFREVVAVRTVGRMHGFLL